jgi:Icc-related predicted phosphoesterase
MCEISFRMNDYQKIVNDFNNYKKITPEESVARHLETTSYLKNILSEKITQRYIIVGHHAPSPFSTVSKNIKNEGVKCAYMTDLTEFIMQNQQIELWVHGHVHENSDYRIGRTRVVCNPRGYQGRQEIADDFQLKYIKI